ncbi:MAG: DUF2490 domain-containing protein [Chitinophagaceae bacterium]|nr:DUF2490 domain-containing protein [Chitinophagaceae bacterium]
MILETDNNKTYVIDRMKKLKIVFVILLCIAQTGFAQTLDLGSWNMLNIKYNQNEKWSVFGEAQLRSLKLYSNFHYYEYKGGINYKAHKNVTITLGAGSYQTFKEGGNFVLPKNNDEFRIWPQVVLSQPLGRINIEQRYRAELRFTSNGYRNRFRYRLGVAYPFGQKRNDYRPFQINMSNELFFTDNEPYFERNRFHIYINLIIELMMKLGETFYK